MEEQEKNDAKLKEELIKEKWNPEKLIIIVMRTVFSNDPIMGIVKEGQTEESLKKKIILQYPVIASKVFLPNGAMAQLTESFIPTISSNFEKENEKGVEFYVEQVAFMGLLKKEANEEIIERMKEVFVPGYRRSQNKIIHAPANATVGGNRIIQ